MNFLSLKVRLNFLKNILISMVVYYGTAAAVCYFITPLLLLYPEYDAGPASWFCFLMMVVYGTIVWPHILAGTCITFQDKSRTKNGQQETR